MILMVEVDDHEGSSVSKTYNFPSPEQQKLLQVFDGQAKELQHHALVGMLEEGEGPVMGLNVLELDALVWSKKTAAQPEDLVSKSRTRFTQKC